MIWGLIIEILCASYQHEVEGFLKTISPYFSRGLKSDDDFPEPHTPTRVIGQNTSVSELPVPQQVKVPRFGGEDSDIPPISAITGQGRLATLLEDNTTKNPLTKADTKQPNRQEDPFSDEGISKAPKKFVPAISKLPEPPSDDSSSESESEPIKPPIPSQSDK